MLTRKDALLETTLLHRTCALFLLAVATTLTTCGQYGSAHTELQVGSILPLTGDVASYGIAARRGADLAIDEINSSGGVGGRPMKVLYEDDQGQAAKAIAALEKLVSVNKVPLVMGSAASSVTLALCPIANRDKVVLITPISSSKELTGRCGSAA